MVKIILLIIVVIFFAMNMGGSGIAPSFAAVYGAKLLSRGKIIFLFSVFVIAGAILLGSNVSLTLGKGLVPKEFMSLKVVFIILISASLSLFLANILKIPQSTSQVTVGAIVGAGLYFRHLYTKTLFLKIFSMWIILPFLSYIITLFLFRFVYPPREENLLTYEKMFIHEKKMRNLGLISSCYVALAIGANNVANVVGPLAGAGIIGIKEGLLLLSPLFGIGSWFLGKGTTETAGKEVVPLGIVSSTLVSFITATLLIFASVMGVPQSLVQLNLCSIFAINSIKNGYSSTIKHSMVRKTVFVWVITPLIAVFLAFFLLSLFMGGKVKWFV